VPVEAKLNRIGRTARKPGNGMTRAALAEHAATTKPGREKNNLRGASRAPTPGCESHFENAPRRGRVAPRTLGERVAPWILYLGWGAGARAAQRQATKVRRMCWYHPKGRRCIERRHRSPIE
jgi:hypothetical protein